MTTEQELASAYDKIARLEAEVRLLRTRVWLAETLSEKMSLSAVLPPVDDLRVENNRMWDALVDRERQRMAALLQHEEAPPQSEVRLRLVDLIR